MVSPVPMEHKKWIENHTDRHSRGDLWITSLFFSISASSLRIFSSSACTSPVTFLRLWMVIAMPAARIDNPSNNNPNHIIKGGISIQLSPGSISGNMSIKKIIPGIMEKRIKSMPSAWKQPAADLGLDAAWRCGRSASNSFSIVSTASSAACFCVRRPDAWKFSAMAAVGKRPTDSFNTCRVPQCGQKKWSMPLERFSSPPQDGQFNEIKSLMD